MTSQEEEDRWASASFPVAAEEASCAPAGLLEAVAAITGWEAELACTDQSYRPVYHLLQPCLIGYVLAAEPNLASLSAAADVAPAWAQEAFKVAFDSAVENRAAVAYYRPHIMLGWLQDLMLSFSTYPSTDSFNFPFFNYCKMVDMFCCL